MFDDQGDDGCGALHVFRSDKSVVDTAVDEFVFCICGKEGDPDLIFELIV